jgi:hypothetical protein
MYKRNNCDWSLVKKMTRRKSTFGMAAILCSLAEA